MNILILVVFIIVMTFIIIFLIKDRKERLKLTDDFFSIKRKYDLIRHPDVFSVEKFNKWFVSPKSNDIYAHAGIFGRTDKLGSSQFIDYFIYLGLTRADAKSFYAENYKIVMKFENDVRTNWLNR